MATEQSAKSHAHRPTNTGILWIMALIALVLVVRHFDWSSRDYALLIITLALFQVGWISRAYIVRLQDRIILLEMSTLR